MIKRLESLSFCSWRRHAADAQPKPVRPFTFILDFLPYGEYTPYFMALTLVPG